MGERTMLKSTKIVRKVDELGRVALPIETRKVLGIEEKDSLEIFVDEEKGRLILQKAFRVCLKCQSDENLKEIKSGFYLCDKCIAKLR